MVAVAVWRRENQAAVLIVAEVMSAFRPVMSGVPPKADIASMIYDFC